MKKQILFFAFMIICENIKGSDHPTDTDTEIIQINVLSGGTHEILVAPGKRQLLISTGSISGSTLSVNIPESVKNMDLQADTISGSTVYIYAAHDDVKITTNIGTTSGSTVKILHPIRKYTYHATIAAVALGIYFYFKK